MSVCSPYLFLWCAAVLVTCGAVHAAPTPFSGATGPIEITSDMLEVDQNTHVATFTGKVVAVQGQMHLTADRMRVFYIAGDAPRPARAEGAAQSIEKIEVEGTVLMTTPTETARGQAGVYHAQSDTLTLTGEVVLTQGKNVLKGAHLVYSMATGKSMMKNAGGQAVSGAKPDRVRALFVPEKTPAPPPPSSPPIHAPEVPVP